VNGAGSYGWGGADGTIWLTLGPQRAMRIEPDEIGPSLQSLSNVFSLELESLLNLERR